VAYAIDPQAGSATAESREPAAGDGAPDLSSLKIRIEHKNRISNLRMEFLKRLYDRRSIAELYRDGKVELHCHFLTGDRVACALFRPRDIKETQSVGVWENIKGEGTFVHNKSDVFINIGQVAKNFRPFATSIRLQRLDRCFMGGIEAVEPSSLLPVRESLLFVLNGKLSVGGDFAAIEDCEFIDEIVESAAEVVTNFSGKNAPRQRNDGLLGVDERRFAAGLRVKLNNNRIQLLLPEQVNLAHKITKVFSCLIYPGEGAGEGTRFSCVNGASYGEVLRSAREWTRSTRARQAAAALVENATATAPEARAESESRRSTECEQPKESYSNSVKNLFNYAARWINERF
jgi:hypothetical protein